MGFGESEGGYGGGGFRARFSFYSFNYSDKQGYNARNT